MTPDQFIEHYPKFFVLSTEHTRMLIDIIELVSDSLLLDFDTVAERFSDSLDEGEVKFAV